jgi:hypothetical protein
MDSESSFEKLCELFESESNQLKNTIDLALKKSEKTIPEIIQAYYQVMKVNSFAKLLKQNFQAQIEPKHKTLLDRIDESQKQIAEKFNSTIHPTTLSYLTDSIRINTDNLNSLSNVSGQKSKEVIEAEATLYKELRELMSTKEFVEQYENGLKDD